MLEYAGHLLLAVIYIAAGVLAISALVAGIEKVFGLNRPH